LSHHGGKRKKLVMPGRSSLLLRGLRKLVGEAGYRRLTGASGEKDVDSRA
jgi:hypothetical protein